jgi:hypothetical protein
MDEKKLPSQAVAINLEKKNCKYFFILKRNKKEKNFTENPIFSQFKKNSKQFRLRKLSAIHFL